MLLLILLIGYPLSAQTDHEFQTYLSELAEEFKIPNIIADSLHSDDFLLLDTREREEYDISHIKNARCIGYNDIDISVLDSVSADAKIVVYCSVGYRSSKIARRLYDKGFSNVFNLHGGIFLWANEGRMLVSGNKSTHNLHAYNRYWSRYITNPAINKIY